MIFRIIPRYLMPPHLINYLFLELFFFFFTNPIKDQSEISFTPHVNFKNNQNNIYLKTIFL